MAFAKRQRTVVPLRAARSRVVDAAGDPVRAIADALDAFVAGLG